MGILHRFLLFLFALVSVVAGAGLVVIAAKLLPERTWVDAVNWYAGRPETFAGLAVYLIVGLELLVSSVARKTERETSGEILLASDLAGSIHVSTAAVKGVAERAARSVRGVRDVQTKLRVSRAKNAAESVLRLSMQLVLGTEAPIKTVADDVHDAVAQELEALLGLSDVELSIAVADITPAKLPHQPRVS
ncbi:alkaline shock response membrane anchor protein AmaP [Selenomonas sp.]|uniref:alkaline shock response membrane anchor protein AmaP n=1 Tax=Selenomonas sp. TaxID=2053611 RepID=UPI0025E58550|nr:alkaline shock response membrane anchor protein AmaP [Selenomonas sp.]MCI6284407.1 alkaline shock response membrane anchor protein AmaP [Selenomonas sp.]